jgi:hypothetical protein
VLLRGCLQSGRPQPFADLRSGLCLLCLAQQSFSRCAGQKQPGFLAPAFRVCDKTLLKRFEFLEAAWLHGAAPLLERAGARSVSQSPIKAGSRAVMPNCSLRPPSCKH